MKKIIVLALTSSLVFGSVSSLNPVISHAENTTVFQVDSVKLAEAKRIFSDLETYESFYTREAGMYHWNEDANQKIPKEVFDKLSEVFDVANSITKEDQLKQNEEQESQQAKDERGVTPFYYAEDLTEYGTESSNYWYHHGSPDIGDWLYLNDDSTRKIINLVYVGSVVAGIAGFILSKIPGWARIAGYCAEIVSMIAAGSASVFSNTNKGNGLWFRYARNKGFSFNAR
ncbi:hypothetical protein [Paenibacillus chitinolyticus]|uniref:hypothetical protein n=1 Tax=Paenibacillus chitinolyticus TaxID=79263 RepID=UPI001C492FA4|nr:hypothetical protein [Paenibacillus chitinolyticus]MBV6716906.1 hypothetical protein [Paenibacillus chitinolyticus]